MWTGGGLAGAHDAGGSGRLLMARDRAVAARGLRSQQLGDRPVEESGHGVFEDAITVHREVQLARKHRSPGRWAVAGAGAGRMRSPMAGGLLCIRPSVDRDGTRD